MYKFTRVNAFEDKKIEEFLKENSYKELIMTASIHSLS